MPHHSHTHTHGAPSGSSANIGLAFCLNLFFTIVELIGGIFTNSIAIISDAVHDFGDCLSLALAWYFQRISRKGSTARYSYGYKRFSLLGAIVNSVVLIVGSVFILVEAVPRIFAPQATNAEGMFLLAAAGIIINGIAALRTRRGASINERVVSMHLLEDVLGWAAVLIGSAVMYFTGFTIIDPILSVMVSVFVLYNVIKNIRSVLPIVLQAAPADISVERVTKKLKDEAAIMDIHDLHIWSLDERYVVLTLHIVVDKNMQFEQSYLLKRRIRSILREENIQHATIEIEAYGEKCGMEDCG